MTNLNYYLWLAKALGPGAPNIGLIFERYKTAKEIFEASEDERKLSGVFSSSQIIKLRDTEIEETYEIIATCANGGIDIITCKDEDYPKNLLQIEDYPIVLFVKGNLACLNNKIPFAVVGTRKPTERSYAAATEVAKAISKCGFLVVSGGALGVDSAAHTGALLAGEKTICVLGAGILNKYLRENEPLREVIAENGALISEYMPNDPASSWSFPLRNRIISGISLGVLVVEGGERSGSLNTASHAARQGRDVFAMPSKGLGNAFKGCDQLIEDGAKPVEYSLDIVGEYLNSFPEFISVDESTDLSIELSLLGIDETEHKAEIEKIVVDYAEKSQEFRDRKKPKKREIVDPLSDNAKMLYEYFNRDPISLKELTDAVNMPISSLLGALTELEIFGYVELLPNTKYLIK